MTTPAWDLWKLIGSSIALDPRRDGFPFGPVVEVPEDADPYTRLAGWMGRAIA